MIPCVIFLCHNKTLPVRKRSIDVAVLSDVHLGTRACKADALLAYLSSIKPDTLILNGDLFDFQRFDKQHFPPVHFKVLKKILGMAAAGTKVYYLTGNCDQVFRKFSGSSIGNLTIQDKLLLNLDGRKTWFFHGDVFDLTAEKTKWIARLGTTGYRFLLRANSVVNWFLLRVGRQPYSLARKIHRGEQAQRHIRNFENTVTDIAIGKRYDTVVCGHIHHPNKQWRETPGGNCLYLNSGDWVKNLTALEYAFKRWKLYRYDEDKLSPFYADEDLKGMDMNELISNIIELKHRKEDREAGEPSDP